MVAKPPQYTDEVVRPVVLAGVSGKGKAEGVSGNRHHVSPDDRCPLGLGADCCDLDGVVPLETEPIRLQDDPQHMRAEGVEAEVA